MQFNRYNSRVLVSFTHSSPDLVDIFEFFNDLQMAYLRIVEYIEQNPSNWDHMLPFTEFANTLDENTLSDNDRFIDVTSSTEQIIVEYVE